MITAKVTGYELVKETISQLELSLQSQIEQLGLACRGKDQVYEDAAQSVTQEAGERLLRLTERLEVGLNHAQEAWRYVVRQYEAQARADSQGREQSDTVQRGLAQLAQGDENLQKLLHQLQSTTNSLDVKLDGILSDVGSNRDAAARSLREALSDMSGSIMNRAQLEVQKRVSQDEVTKEDLLRELQHAREESDRANSKSGMDIAQLREDLRRERKTVEGLAQQVQSFETEARHIDRAQKRWQEDRKTTEILRSQFRELSERLPHLDSIDAKLGKMAKVDSFLRTTAVYLATEQKWMQDQLDIRKKDEISKNEDNSSEHSSLDASDTAMEPQQTKRETASDETKTEASGQADSLRRRVTMNSPFGSMESVVLPPSVEQEQERRRAAAKPRSILKICAQSTTSWREAAEQGFWSPGNQSQYSRPVIGEMSTASDANSKAQQIRSGFIRAETKPARVEFSYHG